jgi:hypothetical protein
MFPKAIPDLLRTLIFSGWGIAIVGAIILRYNSQKLNPKLRRYLAYLGHVDPNDLPGSSPQLTSKSSNQNSSVGSSKASHA